MSYTRKSKGKIVKELLVWCFVLTFLVAIAIGDVDKVPAAAGDANAAEVISEGVSPEGKLSVNFKKNATIKEALASLGGLYRQNIVPSPEVEGVLGFTTLRDVSFEEALKAVIGGKFEYEQNGNIIEVYARGDETRMKYEVFPLHYISAAEAQKLILPILSENGKFGVTSPAATGVPTGESISAGTGGGDTMSLKDTIVLYDYAENIRRAKQVIDAVDARPTQVLVEATILSAKLTEDTQLGIDWQTLKGTAVSSLASISVGDPDYVKSAGNSTVTKSGGMTIGLALGDVGAFIRAVEEITDITIMANPKILAVNKQLGQVYIGTKIGYKSQTTQTDTSTTEQVEFLDTGTKLSFRPYIGNNGYIRMDIHSKDSSGTFNAQNVPDEASAELVTNVMVKDGQTIVIGGLFRDKTTSKENKIPLLGDIPILGAIFKGTSDATERQEVMVLLTPHIIEEPIEAEGATRAEDVSRIYQGSKEELQWINGQRIAQDCYTKAAEYYTDGNYNAALKELTTALYLRPTYLDAIRLKERVIAEMDPKQVKKIERLMLNEVRKKDSEKWVRRQAK